MKTDKVNLAEDENLISTHQKDENDTKNDKEENESENNSDVDDSSVIGDDNELDTQKQQKADHKQDDGLDNQTNEDLDQIGSQNEKEDDLDSNDDDDINKQANDINNNENFKKNNKNEKKNSTEIETNDEGEIHDHRLGPISSLDLSSSLSVLTCLEAFTSPEILTGSESYKCLHCTRRKYHQVQLKLCELSGDFSTLTEPDDIPEEKLKTWVKNTATKQFMLKETPPILTIGLKRFGRTRFGLRKIDTKVLFPYKIDLSPFTYDLPKNTKDVGNDQDLDSKPKQKTFEYYLSGISCHGGGLGGGHYVAYVHRSANNKENENDWYYFSDSHRRESSLEDTLASQAYVLFYKRADTIRNE